MKMDVKRNMNERKVLVALKQTGYNGCCLIHTAMGGTGTCMNHKSDPQFILDGLSIRYKQTK